MPFYDSTAAALFVLPQKLVWPANFGFARRDGWSVLFERERFPSPQLSELVAYLGAYAFRPGKSEFFALLLVKYLATNRSIFLPENVTSCCILHQSFNIIGKEIRTFSRIALSKTLSSSNFFSATCNRILNSLMSSLETSTTDDGAGLTTGTILTFSTVVCDDWTGFFA